MGNKRVSSDIRHSKNPDAEGLGTALEEAKRDHETKVEEIKRDRAALDRRSQAEDARWEKQKEKLETALRRARD